MKIKTIVLAVATVAALATASPGFAAGSADQYSSITNVAACTNPADCSIARRPRLPKATIVPSFQCRPKWKKICIPGRGCKFVYDGKICRSVR
jgi:hypothetical protein